jgi:hypothetical protein
MGVKNCECPVCRRKLSALDFYWYRCECVPGGIAMTLVNEENFYDCGRFQLRVVTSWN